MPSACFSLVFPPLSSGTCRLPFSFIRVRSFVPFIHLLSLVAGSIPFSFYLSISSPVPSGSTPSASIPSVSQAPLIPSVFSLSRCLSCYLILPPSFANSTQCKHYAACSSCSRSGWPERAAAPVLKPIDRSLAILIAVARTHSSRKTCALPPSYSRRLAIHKIDLTCLDGGEPGT